ncbi:hypothetical protein AC579_9120 [Pseudocercospora musae]|uniref:Uncharacterized protein n=1 Tax=Pseudocercospora musae TaxID=113226 RepID=A0A139IJ15_9PEZI|nr:hypothetical protein AC579_9120 [Pseudocercospora musae]
MKGNRKQEKEPITFFTLPGELRNKVYGKVLKRNTGTGPAQLVVVVRYDPIGKCYAHIAAVDVINHEELEPFFGMVEMNVQVGNESLDLFLSRATLRLDAIGAEPPAYRIKMSGVALERFESFEAAALFRIDHSPPPIGLHRHINMSLLTLTFTKCEAPTSDGIWWETRGLRWEMLKGDTGYPYCQEAADEGRATIEGVVDLRVKHIMQTQAVFRQPTLTPDLLDHVKKVMLFSIDAGIRSTPRSEYEHMPHEWAKQHYVKLTETMEGPKVELEWNLLQFPRLRSLLEAVPVVDEEGKLLDVVELAKEEEEV